jgi:hypothetical protein
MPYLCKSSAFFSLMLLLVLISGCNPPVTPSDTSPANLDVSISVLDVDPNPSDHKVPVVVQFLFQGSLVQFNAGETVTCNGVSLTFNGLGYAERVPIQSPGATYSFVYTRNGVNTNVNVPVPQRPLMLTPQNGATVPRTNSLTVTYVADSGSGIEAAASDGATGLGSQGVQPDNGTYSGFNVSQLKAGPGTISITRKFNTTPGGTGFKSAKVSYDCASQNHAVTWS